MNTAKYVLSNLEIVEGALVDAGDNPTAEIRLFKHAPDSGEKKMPKIKSSDPYTWTPRTTAEILAARRFADDFEEVKCAFMDAVNGIMYGPTSTGDLGKFLAQATTEFEQEIDSMLGDVQKNHPEFVEHITALVEQAKERLTIPDADADEIVDGITKSLDAISAVGTTKEKTMSTKNTPAADALATLTDEQRTAVQAQIEAAAVKAKADAETAMKEAADKASAETVTKAIADINKELETNKAELAKMKDEKLTAEFTKVATDIGATDIPATSTLLKAAFGRSKEEGEQLQKVLSAAFAQASEGKKVLLKVVGSSSNDVNDGAKSSAEAQLDAKAEEIRKANPKLTKQQAWAQAFNENNDLAKQIA